VLLGAPVDRLEGREVKPVRPVVSGLSAQRVSLVRAVLERFDAGVDVGREMYVNVVGGLKVDDPCLDLPLALAIVSAQCGMTVRSDQVYCGEIGLLGEILQGPKWEERKRTIERAGFELRTFEQVKQTLYPNWKGIAK